MKFSVLSPLVCASTAAATLLLINCNKNDQSSQPEKESSATEAELVDSEAQPEPKPEPVDPASLPPAARDIAIKVPKALKILEAYHGKRPEKTIERKLHIVYWTPADRDPAPAYQERLQKILEHIQNFYADEMESLGFGRQTVNLDYDPEGKMRIHVVRGEKPYAEYNVQSGGQIRKDCVPVLKKAGIDADKETIVIFCNMANWNEKHRTIRQNSPYYASGTSVKGTAWQVDSEILNLDDLTEKGKFVRDGQYGKKSLGQYNSIFIGGIAHELGHALSLPHNRETADQKKEFGTALMGNGNFTYGEELRGESLGSFLNLGHGLKLAAHPMFNGSAKGFGEIAKREVTNVNIENHGKSFTVSGNVKSDIPVHAVLGYMDPTGGGDYNSHMTVSIPDENGDFSLECKELVPGKTGRLNITFLHVNGDASSFAGPNDKYYHPYSVDKEGNVDLTLALMKLELTDFFAAVNKGTASMDMLPADASPEMREIAQRLVNAKNQSRPLPAPAALPESTKEVVLTDTKYESIKVGYGRPVFDKVPSENPMLVAAERAFSTGLFAHAESRVVYTLGGKWNKLSGFASMANGSWGTAAFVIKGDGKVLWKSGNTKSDQLRNFDLNVEGVQTLELITEDGGDGIGSDWSTWFDVKLKR
ncbi:Putative peptidase family protein [Rubritalea squalenifaciens DSM 18772]|uniref:Putative peptidase family protein n=1 Tax=Rubritalea squalenifaciens DSM 18772 TaxID=1123071 RepID=A0A1M6D558_9BACT|nr:NPCBM/NEW2 domain-containing protein [Rubritalea squalenifaciens]SHI68339.1 Putative peptidase family protein [Rubritalea squalenifaciens DSM 18772]